MLREILLAPEAIEDLRRLSARHRANVRDGLAKHLRYGATRVSRSRIKRLRGLSKPQFRLRIDDLRVFYDVSEECVEVLAIVPKSAAAVWLDQIGVSE